MSNILKQNNNPQTSGWTRRFIACEPRLSEAIELYRESGFEVLLENLSSEKTVIDLTKNELENGCSECFKDAEEEYRIIYTRPKK